MLPFLELLIPLQGTVIVDKISLYEAATSGTCEWANNSDTNFAIAGNIYVVELLILPIRLSRIIQIHGM
jgi:hypothetical protein